MTSRVSVVRTAVGGLLVVAAGLKLAGLAGSAVPPVGWYAQPWVQAAAAGWELVLGAWLLGGFAPRAAWAAAVVTFLAFAGVSASLGLTGVASCGCLGAVKSSPWAAFGIDAAALALLAVGRPRAGEPAPVHRPVFGGVVTGAAAVLVLLGAAGSWLSGSPGAALARLRGDVLTVNPGHLDFGPLSAGEARELPVEVSNWSDRPVRLIGGTSDCTCTTLSDLPVTIAPGDRMAVTVRLAAPPSSGQLTRTVKLRTDHPDQPVVLVRIGCRVE
jgi:hypothetical protein